MIDLGGDIEIVAVNDLAAKDMLLHLLRWDSVHGRFPFEVTETADGFTCEGHEIRYVSERNVADLPWSELNVDVVIESTGLFTDRDKAADHLAAGASKVVISAPA